MLDVFLRTCSNKEVHLSRNRRIIDADKKEIIYRCVESLIKSLSYVDEKYKLTIIDDHSDQDVLNFLKNITKNINCKIINLEKSGNGESMSLAYELALLESSDLVYFVEDDYLHSVETVTEMISCMRNFSNRLMGTQLAFYPADEPDRYLEQIKSCRVVPGNIRHWRTVESCNFTMLTTRYTIIKHWELFKNFSKYNPYTQEFNEEETINRMFKEETGDVILFSPIPALAIHLKDKTPPVVEWPLWWNKNLQQIPVESFISLLGGDKNIKEINKHKYQEKDELRVLLGLVNRFKVKKILEIGVNRGNTAKVILENCNNVEKYLGIDVTKESIPFMTRQEDEVIELDNHAGEEAKDDSRFSVFLHKDGGKALDTKEQYDMVIIDGNHSLDWIKSDTELAFKLGAKVIVWHDYGTIPDVTIFLYNSGLKVFCPGRLRMAVFIGDKNYE